MKISLLVPAYNEEETIEAFYKAAIDDFVAHLPKDEVEIIFVNDGSQDKTAEMIKHLIKIDSRVKYISFSRNFGKDAALLAGLKYVTGDAVIPLDIDLQDPLHVALEFVKIHKEEGCPLVVGCRRKRLDGKVKAFIAGWFYRIYNYISESKITNSNTSEFRLISRPILDELNKSSEVSIFMRGMLDWVGWEGKDRKLVYFDRATRSAGTPKFHFFMSLKYALVGFVSYTSLPLTIWAPLGVTFVGLSILLTWLGILSLIGAHHFGSVYWVVTLVLFLAGLQFTALGAIGRYLWMVLLEAKKRPNYVIKETIGFAKQASFRIENCHH